MDASRPDGALPSHLGEKPWFVVSWGKSKEKWTGGERDVGGQPGLVEHDAEWGAEDPGEEVAKNHSWIV